MPLCCAKLCIKNTLSPEQEAQARHEIELSFAPLNDLNNDVYATLVAFTDAAFTRQLSSSLLKGMEDWVRIVAEVRQQWLRVGNVELFVCHSHVRIGWECLEYEVAKHVLNLLKEKGLDQSPKGAMCGAWYNAMSDNMNRFYPSDIDLSDSESVYFGDDDAVESREDNREDGGLMAFSGQVPPFAFPGLSGGRDSQPNNRPGQGDGSDEDTEMDIDDNPRHAAQKSDGAPAGRADASVTRAA